MRPACTAVRTGRHNHGDSRQSCIGAAKSTPDDCDSLAKTAIPFVFQGGRLDEFVAVYRSFPSVLASALSNSKYGAVAIALVGRANDARLAKQVGVRITTPLAGRIGSLTSREREVPCPCREGLDQQGHR